MEAASRLTSTRARGPAQGKTHTQPKVHQNKHTHKHTHSHTFVNLDISPQRGILNTDSPHAVVEWSPTTYTHTCRITIILWSTEIYQSCVSLVNERLAHTSTNAHMIKDIYLWSFGKFMQQEKTTVALFLCRRHTCKQSDNIAISGFPAFISTAPQRKHTHTLSHINTQ